MRTLLLLIFLIPIISFAQTSEENPSIQHQLDSLEKTILSQSQQNHSRQWIDTSLVNGTGTITEYGTNINGYTFNVFDTAHYGKITVIKEYKNHQLDGRVIQFFNYPNDTASLHHYLSGWLHGSFYYKHRNGQPWITGTYSQNSVVGETTYWNLKGEQIQTDVTFDEAKELYYLSGKIADGRLPVYITHSVGAGQLQGEVYFSNGKIDSLHSYRYAYWGKMAESRDNFVNNTRSYINYYDNGSIKWIYAIKIVSHKHPMLKKERQTVSILNSHKCVLHGKCVTYFNNAEHTISAVEYFEEDKRTGEWTYYDEAGKIIKTETY